METGVQKSFLAENTQIGPKICYMQLEDQPSMGTWKTRWDGRTETDGHFEALDSTEVEN